MIHTLKNEEENQRNNGLFAKTKTSEDVKSWVDGFTRWNFTENIKVPRIIQSLYVRLTPSYIGCSPGRVARMWFSWYVSKPWLLE